MSGILTEIVGREMVGREMEMGGTSVPDSTDVVLEDDADDDNDEDDDEDEDDAVDIGAYAGPHAIGISPGNPFAYIWTFSSFSAFGTSKKQSLCFVSD